MKNRLGVYKYTKYRQFQLANENLQYLLDIDNLSSLLNDEFNTIVSQSFQYLIRIKTKAMAIVLAFIRVAVGSKVVFTLIQRSILLYWKDFKSL